MKETPPELDKIIEFLLINDIGESIISLVDKTIKDDRPSRSKYELIGTVLLAVEDSKVLNHPSNSNSRNPIYLAVFDRAKELMQQT